MISDEMKKYIKSLLTFTCSYGDISNVGEKLGYDSDVIEKALEDTSFYPDDNVAISITRGYKLQNEVLDHIFATMFEAIPEAQNIQFIMD